MSNPWNFDADKFDPADDYKSKIVINDMIKEYLEVGQHGTKLLLVAPKGLGKTLLLRTKSHLYRNISRGTVKFPETDQLTENLHIHYGTFSKDDLLNLSQQKIWTDLWHFSLMLVAIKTYGLKLDAGIEKLFPNVNNVSAVLTILIASGGQMNNILRRYMPTLITQLSLIKSGVAMFIDNVDQQFAPILEEEHYSDFYEEGKISVVKVWVNAQAGLAIAAYEVNKANNHVKAFATIRSEAFESIGQIKAGLLNYCTVLQYQKHEIKSIFESKIKAIDPTKLIYKRGDTEIEKFLGVKTMKHPYAFDNERNNRVEELFDFFYRHSYGRPREVVRFGHELYSHTTNDEEYKNMSIEDKSNRVRSVVNRLSNTYFLEYQNEIIPKFDVDKFKEFVTVVSRNVLTRQEILKLDAHFIKWLYNLGLIGYTNLENAILKQRFLPVSKYNYTKLKDLHHSEYYILHPSLDATIKTKHGRVYNDHCIIGFGNEFYPPTVNSSEDVNEEKAKYDTKGIESCIPILSGDRENTSRTGVHLQPLKDCYAVFFNKEFEKNKSKIEESKIVLDILGYHKAVHLLNKQFKKTYKIEEFTSTPNHVIRVDREYKTLLDINQDTFFHLFTDRLFGRIITVAAFVYLKVSENIIHRYLISGVIDLDIDETRGRVYNDKTDNNSFKYLQACFAIKGLKNDVNKTELDIQNSRKEILNNLSEYELHLIKNWKIDFLAELKRKITRIEYELIEPFFL